MDSLKYILIGFVLMFFSTDIVCAQDQLNMKEIEKQGKDKNVVKNRKKTISSPSKTHKKGISQEKVGFRPYFDEQGKPVLNEVESKKDKKKQKNKDIKTNSKQKLKKSNDSTIIKEKRH